MKGWSASKAMHKVQQKMTITEVRGDQTNLVPSSPQLEGMHQVGPIGWLFL